MDEMNKRAQDRFNVLKNKLKLDLVQQSLGQKPIDAERLDKVFENTDKRKEMLEEIHDNLQNVTKQMDFVDDTFKYIESLNLPSNLSLVIGLVISGYKSGNAADYVKAKDILKAHVLGIAYGKSEEEE